METLVELFLDVPAFVALVVLARRQGRVLAAERESAAIDQRRHERQRAFFANASHALRTPITIARGHTEMAMRSTTDPNVKADLSVALEELDRLTRATERNIRLSVVGELDAQSVHPVDPERAGAGDGRTMEAHRRSSMVGRNARRGQRPAGRSGTADRGAGRA